MECKTIKLTSTSYAVLALLEVLGEATPYDLKQALVSSIENFWRVPHTTFYEEPARLADAGYLSERRELTGRRRRIYALTDRGREALASWAADPTVAPEQVRDEGLLKLFAGADPRAVLPQQIDYHRRKLAELEGYQTGLRTVVDPTTRGRWRGPAVTLEIGIAYHRAMLELLERVLADGLAAQAATGSPAASG